MRKNLTEETIMIYEFSFSNFRSYKNEASIDFTAKPILEFESSLISTNSDISLLPVCAIYGPNGGGKSGVLMALHALRNIVIGPLVQMAFMKKKNEQLAETTLRHLQEGIVESYTVPAYYKWNDEGKNIPTKYSILFQVENCKYRYEIALCSDTIEEENLYFETEDRDVEAVFERDAEGVYLCRELDGLDIDNMNESLPLLSYISMFKNIELVDRALQFFFQMQVMNFDKPRQDRRILVEQLEKDKTRILNVIQSMGIDICDMRIEYEDDGTIQEIYTKHQLSDGTIKELCLYEESSGTRKIVSIIPFILKGIDRGCLFVIDELDAKLHPSLLKKIIELFTDKETNQNAAQMLFTSHDLTTMSNEVFRRDEIWFSAINGYDESVLYSLVDFRKENGSKPRNDENYSKQYLEGRYGADPYMRRIKNWEVVD